MIQFIIICFVISFHDISAFPVQLLAFWLLTFQEDPNSNLIKLVARHCLCWNEEFLRDQFWIHNCINRSSFEIGTYNLLKVQNLGIIFNNTLNCSDHTNAKCGKVYSMLQSLWLTQSFTPRCIRLISAKSYVIPTLLYEPEIFFGCSSIEKKKAKHNVQ